MKKLLLPALMLIFSTAAFAQEIPLTVGINLDYGAMLASWGTDQDNKMDDTAYTLAAGVYFDAAYVCLEVSYTVNIGKPILIQWAGGDDTDISDTVYDDAFAMSAISFTLMGKYPFDLGGWYLYPTAGISYKIVLNYDPDGNGESNVGDAGLDDMNDFLLLGGVGAAFRFDHFVIAPRILVVWNLTPDTDAGGTGGADFYTQWGVVVGLAGGYTF